MTTDEIETLRGLLSAATPGPWQASGVRSRADIKLGPQTSTFSVGPDGDAVVAVFHDDRTGKGFADGKLIAAAVNSLPSLLSEIERLRAEREAKDAILDRARSIVCACLCPQSTEQNWPHDPICAELRSPARQLTAAREGEG